MPYDDNNIFAKILRKEIPCDNVFENDFALAFKDIQPQAPVHILVIPKGRFVSSNDFYQKASDEQIAGLMRALAHVAKQTGVVENGYRFLANHGKNARQEVPHFHIHLFGGRDLGSMLPANPKPAK
jgi:diadenosine tetraphosphate (Ap4A) HIT family hydrolase